MAVISVIIMFKAILFESRSVSKEDEKNIELLRKENEYLQTEMVKFQEKFEKHQNEIKNYQENNEKYKEEIVKLQEKVKSLLQSREQEPKLGHLSREHEDIRLSLVNQMSQLPFYVKGKLKKMERKFSKHINDNTTSSHLTQLIDQTYLEIIEMSNSINLDVMKLGQVDNASVWRVDQLKNLTDTIQKRIHDLQYPADCKKVKKLKCDFDPLCGYGCQIQHIINCMIIAYGTKRTLLPVLDKWHYSPNGWGEFFLPITNCSINDTLVHDSNTTTGTDSDVWHIWSLRETISLVPPAFPKEFSDKLLHLHSDPSLLWISQFLKFLKFKTKIESYLSDKEKLASFTEPTVGIHIRRTDKIIFDTFVFTIEEYMEHAEAWFRLQALKYPNKASSKKRIVLITDEPQIINETIAKYPSYEFIYDKSHSMSAHSNRYNATSLYDVLADIHLLSKCDYIVCTLSSNICRLIYEYGLLDFDKNGDFTHNLVSLDNIYYFWGQQRREQVAIHDHQPDLENGEIELKIDDVLEVKLPYLFVRNRLDGFIEGTNRRTGKVGFYPLFKVKEKWLIADF